MDKAAIGSSIGAPVRRREDLRLVRGAGRYTADENLPGQTYAVMVRSPHAQIRAIATERARAAPGVVAVLTSADLLADELKPVPHKPWSPHPAETKLRNKGDAPPFEAPHWPLPADKARFVGEAVAMVVANTVHAAKDGAERVEVDYEMLPAVVETAAAARQDAPQVHDAPSNVCDSGQLLAGSFMDYAMPRAPDLPFYATELSEVPSSTHPLGIRPAGEGGTEPALAAVVDAIVDALSEFGVRHIEIPAMPERVWRAIADARRQ